METHDAEVSEPLPFRNWRRYELLSLLGRGGMGAVYKAIDRKLDRTVAIKVISIRNEDAAEKDKLRRRFEREASLQSALDHPHICKVYEVDEVEGQPYIAMQHIDGVPFNDLYARLSQEEKVKIVVQIADALHVAHERGMIHRDIKPSNIMVETRGPGQYWPYLLDFGLARQIDAKQTTMSLSIDGTPAFMAPEQVTGDTTELDARADVYSLGATLYDAITGRPPHVSDSPVELFFKIVSMEPLAPRVLQPSIPRDLELVVMKSLQKDRSQRYSTAHAVSVDLTAFLAAEPIRVRLPGPIYKARRWARGNKMVAALGASLILAIIAMAGYGVNKSIAAVRRDRMLKEQAALTQKLGEEMKDIEWLLRSSRQLPLHDLRREKAIVRGAMVDMQREMRSAGPIGEPLAHYAIGRGYIALEEYDSALPELEQAQRLQYTDPELDYALGLALGKQFEKAMYEARMSGGGEWAKSKLADYEMLYLRPAVAALESGRNSRSTDAHYLAGLIAYYERDWDRALGEAAEALHAAPWLYEAEMLSGDVFLTQANEAKDAGASSAEMFFDSALVHYRAAAAIAPSDALVHEANAEAHARLTELHLHGGFADESNASAAIASAREASIAAPDRARGVTTAAYAQSFLNNALDNIGLPIPASNIDTCLSLAKEALAVEPQSAHAADALVCCSMYKDDLTLHAAAAKILATALETHSTFIWGWNDLACLQSLDALQNERAGRGGGAQLFSESLQAFHHALSVDPNYLSGYINALLAISRLVQIDGDKGVAPDIHEAPALYDSCLRLDPHRFDCYENYADVLLASARAKSVRHEDAHADAEGALSVCAKARVATEASCRPDALATARRLASLR